VWPLKLVYSFENVELCRISLRALQHSLNKHNTDYHYISSEKKGTEHLVTKACNSKIQCQFFCKFFLSHSLHKVKVNMWNTKSSLWFKTKLNCGHIYGPSYVSNIPPLGSNRVCCRREGGLRCGEKRRGGDVDDDDTDKDDDTDVNEYE
jgi:hypothetical protein